MASVLRPRLSQTPSKVRGRRRRYYEDAVAENAELARKYGVPFKYDRDGGDDMSTLEYQYELLFINFVNHIAEDLLDIEEEHDEDE